VEEYTEEKIKELNKMTDDEILLAFKALEKLLILRKMGDKQLNV